MENRKRWILTAFSAVLALTVLFTGCAETEQPGSSSSDTSSDTVLSEPDGSSSEVQSDPVGSESDPAGSESESGSSEPDSETQSTTVGSETSDTTEEPTGNETEPGDENPEGGDETQSTTTGGDTTTGTQEEDPTGGTVPSAPVVKSLEFTVSEDGRYYIVTGMGTYTDAIVVIPETYDGLPVKEIAGEAFKGYVNIEKIEFSANLKTVGSSAFKGCTALKGLVIPATLGEIGASAFEDCAGLETVTFAERTATLNLGAAAFRNCVKLPAVVLPAEAVTVISASLFEGCTALTSFTVPANVTSIGDAAFKGCVGISEIVIPANVLSIGASAFERSGVATLTFAQNAKLTSIGDNAFLRCAIETLALPAKVTQIGAAAFKECKNITELKIPKSVVSIGDSAFEKCAKIAKLTLASDGALSSIGASAFGGCSLLVTESAGATSVATLTIPASVSEIGNAAFYGCLTVQKVVFADNSSLVALGNAAFNGCSAITEVDFGKNSSLTAIGSSAFSSCVSLNKLTFGEGCKLESIGESAFVGCTGLQELVLPETVKTVGATAFKNCSALATVDLKNAESIGVGAFENCIAIGKITLPDAATTISASTFKGCAALSKVDFKNVTEIGESAFESCAALTSSENDDFVIPKTIKIIGKNAFKGCSSIQKLTFTCEGNEGVQTIGESAFENCTALASNAAAALIIPQSVDTIGKSAFKGCSSLEAITFACEGTNGVQTIGGTAFSGCIGIKSLQIPATVTEIGAGAFGACDTLESISVPFVGEKADGTGATSFAHIFVEASGGKIPPTLATVEITGGRSIADSAFETAITIKTIKLPATVKTIGASAFKNCSSLNAVTLPVNLTEIGAEAFKGCASLAAITIPAKTVSIGVSLFENCKALSQISVADGNTTYKAVNNCLIEIASKTLIAACLGYEIPADGSVQVIGKRAFANCGFTSVTIPEGVLTIDEYAFDNCVSLEEINLPKSLTSLATTAFNGCNQRATITVASGSSAFKAEGNCLLTADGKGLILGTNLSEIPNTVTAIYDSAFAGTSITEMNVPATVKTVGASAFANCSKLTSIVLPTVTEIGGGAFAGCNALTEIEIPFVGGSALSDENTDFIYIFGSAVPATLKKVVITADESIAAGAFRNCGNIAELVLPETLTAFGASALEGCTAITSLTIPFVGEKADGTGDTRFASLFGGNTESVPATLTEVILVGCTAIGQNAFMNCTAIENVVLPDTLRTIGASAFEGCVALANMEVPTGVTEIGEAAFKGCTKLTGITLPFVGQKADGTGDVGFAYIFGGIDEIPALLTQVTLVGCESIPQEAFKDCTTIQTVILPTTLKEIGASAFENCEAITQINLQMIEKLGPNAFKNCFALESISVSQSNTVFAVYQNCLITNDTETGLRTVALGCKNSVIPLDVEAIGYAAFSGCSDLTEIMIPANVRFIHRNAFEDCVGLETVIFENNENWWYSSSVSSLGWTKVSDEMMANPALALTDELCAYVWKYEE